MALTITHAQVAGTGADADAIVDGADWDANHTISGSIAASEVTGGAALTKTDDTNVTLTLGGTPTTALLQATSITVGWTGTLAASRGGTGISSLGTGVATALGVNVGSAGAFVVNGGALGTPSSGVATNLTGTASGLTAGTVTTNANLTGPITSVGNATSIASQTGTGTTFVVDTSPTLVTPVLGVATATSINKVAFTAPATSATLTIPDGVTLTGPASSGTAMTLGNTETVTGVKTFGSAGAVGRLKIAGTTSGAITLDATAVAGSGTLTLPAATDTLVGKATTDTFTNKTFNSSGTGNTLQVSGVTVSAGQYPGETTTGSATAGNVGELTGSTVASGSAVSLTTATNANVTSISLTAGDWDVFGAISYNHASTTNVTTHLSSISNTSATLDNTQGNYFVGRYGASGLVPQAEMGGFTIGPVRKSLSGTTTIYLVARADFTVSTCSAYGRLWARRVR